MSLFDLQDVCIAIGSLATLYLPMVVDLIGIYVLKGPYCMLTTTNWFLQALSVIPRGSWGDDARRFTMIRWARSHKYWIHDSRTETELNVLSMGRGFWGVRLPKSQQGALITTHNYTNPSLQISAAPLLLYLAASDRPPPPPPPDFRVVGLVSISATSRIRSCQNLLDFLVQIDGEIAFPVVDLIRRSTAIFAWSDLFRSARRVESDRAKIYDLPPSTIQEPEFPVNLVGARRLDASKITIDKRPMNGLLIGFNVLNVSRGKILTSAVPPGNGIRIRHCRQQSVRFSVLILADL
ncbi:hypothetical protein F511_27445 [Dorcoceras hygrometricum]|uniref:Uncharacterized protein n=1 Tax=Dorcoceras hygrometricum TaxID=472368 RepID=A0A2Z7DCT5_9LAMI|nr:hypothetical protein F511_27445 [Dorcoceras hygrometricum]